MGDRTEESVGWESPGPQTIAVIPPPASVVVLAYERPTYDEQSAWSRRTRATLAGVGILFSLAAVGAFVIVHSEAGTGAGISAAVVPAGIATFWLLLRGLAGRVRTFDDLLELSYEWGGRTLWQKRIRWRTVTACEAIASVASAVKSAGAVRTVGLFGRGAGVVIAVAQAERYAIASTDPQRLADMINAARTSSFNLAATPADAALRLN